MIDRIVSLELDMARFELREDGELSPADINSNSELIANAEHPADFAQVEIRLAEAE